MGTRGPRNISYWPHAGAQSAAAGGRPPGQAEGARGSGGRAPRRPREAERRTARREGLRRGPPLWSPGFSGSRTTPGGTHAATPRAVLALPSPTRLRDLSRFPLSKKRAQFRGRNPRSFLGNGVPVERILGVVVPTVHRAHAHFRFTSRFPLLGSTGKETGASVHVRPPTVCPRAPCPVGREPGVASDRRTWVPVSHSR